MRGDRQSIMRFWVLCLAVLVCSSAAAQQTNRERYDRAAPADKQFVDVVLDLRQSIGQHNFAVVGQNEIGQAVRQRGHPDFGEAAIVHFCNLEYARRIMNIDRALILYMPCRIAVFESGDRVHAVSLLLPEAIDSPRFNALAKEINGILRDIIDYAVAANQPAADSGNR